MWQAQTGQTLARSTVENVAHLHRDPIHDYDIVRRVRPQIPSLSFAHFDDRDLFCQWAIRKLLEGAIFIHSDESNLEIGGGHRTKPKISRPRGQVNTFKRALPVRKPQFSIMIWAAICAEWDGPFPFYIWDDSFEDAKAKERNAAELDQENVHRKHAVDNARHAAQHNASSNEARALQEINGNIKRENTTRR